MYITELVGLDLYNEPRFMKTMLRMTEIHGQSVAKF